MCIEELSSLTSHLEEKKKPRHLCMIITSYITNRTFKMLYYERYRHSMNSKLTCIER